MSDNKDEKIGEMHARRTTMDDGRYLIYFEFGEENKDNEKTQAEQTKSDV